VNQSVSVESYGLRGVALLDEGWEKLAFPEGGKYFIAVSFFEGSRLRGWLGFNFKKNSPGASREGH
jgi:hypothetical protein